MRSTTFPCARCAAALFLCLSVPAPPALAQTVCGPRAEMLAHLEGRHGERPVARGLMRSGQVLEVLAGEAGGWTALLTLPDGRACLMAAGEAWETLPAGKAPRPAAPGLPS